MTGRPLVALGAYLVEPGRVHGWSDAGVAAPAPYVEALRRAGGQEAIVMPEALGPDDAAALLARFDGVLLVGGGDLDPATYGQERHERTYGVSTVRDAFELALCKAALTAGMPMLAICRGAQVLNVAKGGSLDQHITDRYPGHGTPGEAGASAVHDVMVEAGTRTAAALGTTRARCSCHHHQAVARVGEGLRVAARAPDGLIEALETRADPWVVAVQWHPEDTAAVDPAQQRVFDALVRACPA